MYTLRRCSAFIFIIGILFVVMSGCAAKKEEASYEERRRMPLNGELSMEAMEFVGAEPGSADLVSFSYLSEDMQISLCVDDRYESARVAYREKSTIFLLQVTVRRERSRRKSA